MSGRKWWAKKLAWIATARTTVLRNGGWGAKRMSKTRITRTMQEPTAAYMKPEKSGTSITLKIPGSG